ncbi:MAG: hypothetical protein RLZZ11_98 [Cyanobacteriota bacterium]
MRQALMGLSSAWRHVIDAKGAPYRAPYHRLRMDTLAVGVPPGRVSVIQE